MNRPSRHPVARRSVSHATVVAEFRALWRRAVHARAAQGRPLPGAAVVVFDDGLTALHPEDPRRYGQVLPGRTPRFELADQVRHLPRAHRRGLLAHEIGHVLAGPRGSEAEADRAAARVLGVKIGYDHRWPGKGLQVARPTRRRR